jgi:hypothetical protein
MLLTGRMGLHSQGRVTPYIHGFDTGLLAFVHSTSIRPQNPYNSHGDTLQQYDDMISRLQNTASLKNHQSSVVKDKISIQFQSNLT